MIEKPVNVSFPERDRVVDKVIAVGRGLANRWAHLKKEALVKAFQFHGQVAADSAVVIVGSMKST